MKLSILTATYNREHTLTKLYESIKNNFNNSKLNCEWIIIDDGSTDDTKFLIDSFIKENIVNIKYHFQNNSGKMVAINKAAELSTGDLIIDCDSDDFFTDNAFDLIYKYSDTLLNNTSLYGLAFLKLQSDLTISEKNFKFTNTPTTMFDLYFKYGFNGETAIVFNSKIRKLFSHELENNEKFITEARMYHKMDEKYNIICINEIIEYGDYQNDGYTKNITKQFKESPFGYYKYFEEILSKDMKGFLFLKKLYVIKHFILFGTLTNSKFNANCIKNFSNKFLYTILYLPGKIKSKHF